MLICEVNVNCTVKLKLGWTRNQKLIKNYSMGPKSYLHISNFSAENVGNYTCQAVVSSSSQVLQKKRITIHLSDQGKEIS